MNPTSRIVLDALVPTDVAPEEHLERARELAGSGATDLATIELIRVLARLRRAGQEASALYVDALNDLAVLRFSAGDHDGSSRLLGEALRLDPRHRLARENLLDVSATWLDVNATWSRRKPR